LTAGNGDISNDPHGGRTKGSFENPEHQYAVIGTYTVKLTVESDKGCVNTLIKSISIFPQINTFPYREDFETNGKNGWVSGGKNPSWQLRPTDLSPRTDSLFIQYAASGHNAWITNDDSTYNNNEFSYVESPCFDLRPLARPMIVIKTAYFIDRGLDGAILQATIDDGVNWKTVGELQEGENWYNTALIIAHPDSLAPINDRAGWSGIDTLWKESRYPLDDFKNQPLVRFRIAFGSNSENTPGIPPAGFAFDDVFIGERSRIVLLEHFTNTNSDVSLPPDTIKINDKVINTYITNEAVVLRYHVEIPGKDDPINQENKADPSARALLYGISSLPRTAIDGQSILNDTKRNVPFITSENNASGNFGPKQYKSRTLVQSPFSINISFASPDTSLRITADITKTDVASQDPFVVQMALVQKLVVIGTDTFKNVVRKLLPNAAGTRIDDPAWAQGASKSVKDTLIPNTILGPLLQSQSDGFAIAVFIQDERSKEVYQAIIEDIPADRITSLVTGIDELHNRNVTIYPNPASRVVYVRFSQKLTESLELKVFDAYGKTIDSQIIERGSSDFILHTDTYSNGFYILEARQYGNQSGVRKKLVIAK
jgi:PKD repeat protein